MSVMLTGLAQIRPLQEAYALLLCEAVGSWRRSAHLIIQTVMMVRSTTMYAA